MADHHGDGPMPDDPAGMKRIQARNELMRSLLETTSFRGALGDFPEGQLTKTDEGAIQFAIGEKDGKVVVDFGTSVHWLGMSPQQAAAFASLLLKKAKIVAARKGETVTFMI